MAKVKPVEIPAQVLLQIVHKYDLMVWHANTTKSKQITADRLELAKTYLRDELKPFNVDVKFEAEKKNEED